MRLSRKEIGNLGLYDFLGYIGSMNQSTFGGKEGTPRLINQLGIAENNTAKILEIGCATGYVTYDVARLLQPLGHVTGVDISEVLITKAQEKKEKHRVATMDFLVADAYKLPFNDNEFDIVFAEALVALLPDKEKVLQEFLRVLKPSGIIGTLDAFAKPETPKAILAEISNAMSGVMGTEVNILTLDNWQAFYSSLGLKNVQINPYYEGVFQRTTRLREVIPAMFKLLYHLLINKKVRQKVLPVMKLARKVMKKDSVVLSHMGYLVFTGQK